MGNSLGLLAQTSSLVDAQRFLGEWWGAQSLPEEARFPFELAVEELFVNIATHGQAALDRDVNVELQLEWLGTPDNKVILTISDDGPQFDPTAKETPDTDAPLDNRTTGGLGIHLTRSLMDSVTYRAINGRNQLRLEKHVG